MTGHRMLASTVAIAVLALVAAACTSSTSAVSPTTASTSVPGTGAPSGAPHSSGPPKTPQTTVPPESPVPAESNPPGDIPDSTVFIAYHSPAGGFVVKVPEGWSRRTTHSNVSFTDKLNTVSVTWFQASAPPSQQTAKSSDVPQLRATERAFTLSNILVCSPSCTIPYSTGPIAVTLPAGPAVVITYRANSAPNSVTGKQYRLEVLRFEFFKGGLEAALTLSGPVGSDNVDPWRLVSESFRWA